MFDPEVLTAAPLFYRSYSRKEGERRESLEEVARRVERGLRSFRVLTNEQIESVATHIIERKVFPSGRYLWVGGTEWAKKPENYYGCYNCTSTIIESLESIAHCMGLAMMGCGTGAVLSMEAINKLPKIVNKLDIKISKQIGEIDPLHRMEATHVIKEPAHRLIVVGDSRQGWVDSYIKLIEIASEETGEENIEVVIDLGNVRKKGEVLKGFGGIANPDLLPRLYEKVGRILNKAATKKRKLNSLEVCLIIDEAALVVVSGNIRRSAGMRQGDKFDVNFVNAKENLWQVDNNNNWFIDPERDALRMANHTILFHNKPTLSECITAVSKQYYSGEGAIQWTGEALMRANCDLIENPHEKEIVYELIEQGRFEEYLRNNKKISDEYEIHHRMSRYGVNPCGEILGTNFLCNLSEVHLNKIDPLDFDEITKAFEVATWNAAPLLLQKFHHEIYKKSRNLDPIIGISFTGLFDFFVNLFGIEWLRWWKEGRKRGNMKAKYYLGQEREYLKLFRIIVKRTLEEFCKENNIKMPNRYTTVQPAGSKSLLTGASPGWHPPKAIRYIRRMTFGVNDPVALACIDYGYNVVPSQSSTDENGNLLDDPYDPRVKEWLVEMPIEVSWANIEGVEEIDPSKFSIEAQFDFVMQVQKYYVTHNASSTLEISENEIEKLGILIFNAIERNEGYISAAILQRSSDCVSFPRLPFEPITREEYKKLSIERKNRQRYSTFDEALAANDQDILETTGSMGCDSDKCLFTPLSKYT